MKVVVRAAAAADIEDAYRWYRGRRPGLGREFLDEVRAVGARILEHPEAYPVYYRKARRIRMRRFPFSVIYRVYADVIVVVACLHGRLDPRKWRSRADG